ncbi:hypothetical protein DFH07DRAFT_820848 [Mycena maculata]|uniref:Uncharacterized protein n=1 Tax=Mycena maculata TaxID=230809 RepID=A0AAD7NEL1_9AGAR|nr:hypothetical protein DFH07DRAFT_820848 [Mycena maculata]
MKNCPREMASLQVSAPLATSDATLDSITPTLNGDEVELEAEDTVLETGAQKKKKKKKPKKSASAKARDAAVAAENAKTDAQAKEEEAGRPPVLCISRNKHWRYISSYHGPWLQLPLELLESLLTLNLDPATLAAPEPRSPLYPPSSSMGSSVHNPKRNGHNHAFPDLSPPDSPRTSSLSSASASITFSASSSGNLPPPFPVPEPGKPTPPPIDPGVFRNVTSIRRLIDEAAELSVRASSGLSAAELNMMRSSSSPSMNSGYSNYNSPWAGLIPGVGGGAGGGGRNVAMSAMRIHRLRALAVQKLAAAYTADEIASSVMVMQGGSVFDDLAERVLKVDPTDADARYVHFFHEKIPSRQLAESTTTQVLDELIQGQPQKLEYYRTRGIVHCFRDGYSLATKDFTHALKEARAVRKAKVSHHHNYSATSQNGKHGGGKGGKKRKGGANGKQKKFMEDDGDDDAGEDGGGDADADADDAGYVPHPSVLSDAPTPLEPQLLFLRGAAYLQHAVHLIESTVLKLEGVHKYSAYSTTTSDGHGVGHGGNANGANANNGELRLSYLDGGLYGGVEVGNPDGPLGRSTGKKAKAYREAFGIAEHGEGVAGPGDKVKEQILALVKKSMRDHERFLGHFDSLDAGPRFAPGGGDEAWNLAQRVEYAFLLSESIRPGSQSPPPPHPHTPSPNGGPLSNYDPTTPAATGQIPPPPTTFTTYHPLLVEAHFSILLCQLMLGDFTALLSTFVRTAGVVDGLEGYPVFLPPRSMAQAEFVEVLERLAGGWKAGVGIYSVPGESSANGRGKAKEKERLAIEDRLQTEITDEPQHHLPSTRPLMHKVGQGSSSSSATSNSRPNSVPDSAPCDPLPNGHSTSSSSSTSPSETRSATPVPPSPYAQALNSARILLAPVFARQRAREAEKLSLSKKGGVKKPMNINIPLHGPRVDVILAWLGAVQIPALEAVV